MWFHHLDIILRFFLSLFSQVELSNFSGIFYNNGQGMPCGRNSSYSFIPILLKLHWCFSFCFYESTVFDCNEILLPESVKHAVWIQIRPDILSGLIWVQTVSKGVVTRNPVSLDAVSTAAKVLPVKSLNLIRAFLRGQKYFYRVHPRMGPIHFVRKLLMFC